MRTALSPRRPARPKLLGVTGLWTVLTVLVFPVPSRASSVPASAAEKRGKPFWLALAGDCTVPAGESAFGLVSEAVSFLGSPDSQWRDDVGYGVVASCVYQKRRLTPGERHGRLRALGVGLAHPRQNHVESPTFLTPDLIGYARGSHKEMADAARVRTGLQVPDLRESAEVDCGGCSIQQR